MSSQKKIKLLYLSDFTLAKTGFGRAAKDLIEYLYRTGRYEIVHACMQTAEHDPMLAATPWKSIGVIPQDPHHVEMMKADPGLRQYAAYGHFRLNDIVRTEKPDIFLGVQDIWALHPILKAPWFNKIETILWTTLDSLPVHKMALEASKACKDGNFWVWSNFAEKAMKEDGYANVRTVHSLFDPSEFFRLPKTIKNQLRDKYNIPIDAWICGDVFRNQLRKTVPALMEGYSLFKIRNPQVKNPRLLLHTSFSEGWDIGKLAKDYKIESAEILTTYICGSCLEYEIKPFTKEDTDCRFCGRSACQKTTSPSLGVSNAQLNEIYNLMNVLVVARTSGGSEFPIFEYKLTEGITLVTNYSFGEEATEEGSESIILDWTGYRDLTQSQFLKAATHPQSVAKQLTKVYNMPKEDREKMGKNARKWTIENYSVDKVANWVDKYLSSLSESGYDFNFEEEKLNPDAIIPEIENDTEWLKSMYKLILNMNVDENNDGLKSWLSRLEKVK